MITERLLKIYKSVTGKDISTNEFRNDMNLVEDLGLNSIGILYMVVGIEEEFNIKLSNLNVNDFKTVGSVISFLERKIK